uniref:Reverse transcriptase domain-containing protein n=1 Tax=Macrostomum lignano TaxID=282301 RepID=A0A1I8F9P3_9PLAT
PVVIVRTIWLRGKSTLIKGSVDAKYDGPICVQRGHTILHRPATMESMIARGDFIESAQFSGNFYGTSKAPCRQSSVCAAVAQSRRTECSPRLSAAKAEMSTDRQLEILTPSSLMTTWKRATAELEEFLLEDIHLAREKRVK